MTNASPLINPPKRLTMPAIIATATLPSPTSRVALAGDVHDSLIGQRLLARHENGDVAVGRLRRATDGLVLELEIALESGRITVELADDPLSDRPGVMPASEVYVGGVKPTPIEHAFDAVKP